ncbi:hypothetical protein [Nocardioides campestrisoli]|uniref:hypothetical protein n=1 Tax=Nocardioides campestrisoli TaxID=2736757 RepID=UPI0015E71D76|nr:hypothetical protein [Nocardioides campestrisoli]
MRFTEHELTTALTAAAKTMVAARRKDVRKGKATVDDVWESMDRYQRYQLLDGLGDQLLPVLLALPDVEVPDGTSPAFSDAQVVAAVEESLGEAGGRLKRKVLVAGRAALVRAALDALPPRWTPPE